MQNERLHEAVKVTLLVVAGSSLAVLLWCVWYFVLSTQTQCGGLSSC